MTKFDELKARFPNLIPVQELRASVSIIELAVQYGYEPQLKKGRSRPVLVHPGYQDTIIIKNPNDAGQQVYQRAGDFTDSGTIIDFIRNRLGSVFSTFNRPAQNEFTNITSVLYDYLRIDPMQASKNRKITAQLTESGPGPKQPFAKDQFDLRPLEPDNYLNKRHIAPQTLSRPEFAGKVVSQITYFNPATGHAESFQSAREQPELRLIPLRNIAFPYYNGQSTDVTGLELRSDSGAKLHAPGSDRYGSVFVSNPPPYTERFYVLESGIDALSHRQLRTIAGDDRFDSVYFSTGGQLTSEQVNTIARYMTSFAKADTWRIHLSFDNDAKGHRFDLQFIQQLTATRFPLTPTVGSTGRIAYLLPEQETYRPIREALLERVENFNQTIRADFGNTANDALGQKEIAGQLVTIGRLGTQIQVSIPETCPALAAMSQLLIEKTGFDKRVTMEKSISKDFNLDLTREVRIGEKFSLVIYDDKGQVLVNGNSAGQMVRSFQQIQRQVMEDKATGRVALSEREPFGFRQMLAEVSLQQGIVVKKEKSPELEQRVSLEKKQQHQTVNQESLPSESTARSIKPRID